MHLWAITPSALCHLGSTNSWFTQYSLEYLTGKNPNELTLKCFLPHVESQSLNLNDILIA